MVAARPEAAHGKELVSTTFLRRAASVSVSPTQATSGSVKTTAGTTRSKVAGRPARTSAATLP